MFLSLAWLLGATTLHASEINEQAKTIQEQQIYAQAQKELSISLTNRATAQKGKWYGACVIGVRQFLGVGRDQISGWAKNTRINSQSPTVGAVIVLSMSRYGHVGVVLSFDESQITYYDTNYHWNGRAGVQTIKINDKRIKGFKIL